MAESWLDSAGRVEEEAAWPAGKPEVAVGSTVLFALARRLWTRSSSTLTLLLRLSLSSLSSMTSFSSVATCIFLRFRLFCADNRLR